MSNCYRFKYEENMAAGKEILNKYDEHLIGEICLRIFSYHSENPICYELDNDASKVYQEMFDKYNGQFNLKYAGK